MKSRLFPCVIILIIAGCNFAYAQEKLSIGLSTQIHNTKLVVNATSLNVKGAYRPTSVLFAEYDIGKNMAIHTGLGYTMMTQNSDAFRNNFHYLAMPVYLKYGRIKEGKKFTFTGFFGGNLHYLLKAEHVDSEENKSTIYEECRKVHFDLTFGGGLKFRLSDRITAEALASFSLGYMVNKYNVALVDVHNINSGFMFNLSYRLR